MGPKTEVTTVVGSAALVDATQTLGFVESVKAMGLSFRAHVGPQDTQYVAKWGSCSPSSCMHEVGHPFLV